MSKIAVVAVGGNALAREHEVGTVEDQFRNAAQTCEALADLIVSGWDIVLTHGNGPQVGNLLYRVELASHAVHPLPLFLCGANTQGGIGLILQQSLGNALRYRGITRPIATLVTQVRVDPNDPSFQKPTKPIGPFFPSNIAQELHLTRGWTLREIQPGRWRRVVPSPQPKEIVELNSIRALLETGEIPIALGGGGVPVQRDGTSLRGIDAVIDKDHSSAMLASALGAEVLLLCTGTPHAMVDFGKATQRTISTATPAQCAEWLSEGQFPAGSMGPKVEAAVAFAREGTGRAVICDETNLVAAVQGSGGTQIASEKRQTPEV